jgi:hypothetical protein
LDAERADIIDFLVKLLKEHEKNLSRQIDRLEASMKLLEANARYAPERPRRAGASEGYGKRRKGVQIGIGDGDGKGESRREREGKKGEERERKGEGEEKGKRERKSGGKTRGE